MKTIIIILTSIILIIGTAAHGRCQPELVYVENEIERKIDGIEKTEPYYIENGEKKFFNGEGEYFLKTKDDDFLSWGYVTVNYIVKPDKAGVNKAITIINDRTGKNYWNRLTKKSLLKIWNKESINNARCFMAWYEPGSNLVKVGNLGFIPFKNEKPFNEHMSVNIGSIENKGFPVIFFFKENMLIPPDPVETDGEVFFHSLISGYLKSIENIEKPDRLAKMEDRLGNRLIHFAAAFGYTELLKSLINKGVKIDEKNENNMTPLLLASAAGHKEIVDVLLEHKADIKQRDNDKRTALHYASYNGHEAIVEELIKYEKDINSEDILFFTPIQCAINEKHDSIVGLLAPRKANMKSDKENQQLLLIDSVSSGNYHTASFLLDHKASANGEIYGTTPLIVAAGRSSLEVVNLLVNSGAKVDKVDNKNLTPLLSACLTGRPEVVKYLLEKGARVNVKTNSGLSAIEAAVLRNDPEMIDLLISHGANIESKDESGKTLVWIAAMLGHRKSMKKLIDAGARCDLDQETAIVLMEVAFRYDMPEAVELALGQCLKADFLFYGKYPSTWAAEYYSSDEILGLLIKHGAKIDDGEGLGIVPIKDISESPKIIEATPVYYPLDLKRKYGSRKFHVKVVIDDQGRVFFPKIVESMAPELDRIVMANITKWRFTAPKNASGESCSIIVNVPVLLECDEIDKKTYEIVEVDTPPRVIKAIPPKFPQEYSVGGIQGRVMLEIIIDENGLPENIKIASLTHKGFADAAIEAARGYQFSPSYYQGKPVKVKVRLPIIFTLDY